EKHDHVLNLLNSGAFVGTNPTGELITSGLAEIYFSSGRAFRSPFGLRSWRGGGGSRPPFAARWRSLLRLRRRRSGHRRCGTIRPPVPCGRPRGGAERAQCSPSRASARTTAPSSAGQLNSPPSTRVRSLLGAHPSPACTSSNS